MVLSWGRGEDGQLGHGDAQDRQRPQAVLSLLHRSISSVHCGAEYSVAVSATDKQLYSWGELAVLSCCLACRPGFHAC